MLDAFSWRRFLVYSGLLGVAALIKLRPHSVDTSAPPPAELELEVPPSPPTQATAADDRPPSFDAVPALLTIGRDALSKLTPSIPATGLIEAAGACERPDAKAMKQLRVRLKGWIAGQHPSYKLMPGSLEVSVGCIEPSGVVVSFGVDLESRVQHYDRMSRWWVARLTDTDVTVIADKMGTAKVDWQEWADIGVVYAAALVDLDGDKNRDVVWIRTEQEGGAAHGYAQINVLRSTTGTSAEIFNTTSMLDIRVRGDSLIVGAGDNGTTYRCISTELKFERCRAADAAQLRADRVAAAQRLASITQDDLTDREAIAADLELLQVPAEDRIPILDVIPIASPANRARRDVDAFLERLRTDEPLGGVAEATHPTAQTHFAEIRAALGEAPCGDTGAVAGEERTRVTEWIKREAGRNEASLVTITRACGPYVWAAWEITARDTGWRREVLLLLGDDTITRVLSLAAEPTGEPGFPAAFTTGTATFVRHGDEIIGTVIRSLSDGVGELYAIHGGRVVGKRSGAFVSYRYNDYWGDTSDALVVDANTKAWWHATPNGLERFTLEVLQAHAKRRTAMERLGAEPLTRAHAGLLRQLGAPAALVRQIAAL